MKNKNIIASSINDRLIFKDRPFMDLKEQFVVFGTACYILSIAAESNDVKEFRRTTNIADSLMINVDCKEYWTLRESVMDSFYYFHSQVKDEAYYVELFKKNIDKLIPGSSIVKRKGSKKSIPDAWVELDDLSQLPVEAKKGSFDQKALTQLQRYIDEFGTRYGIAIGKTLDVELPDSISFFSLDEIEKMDASQG